MSTKQAAKTTNESSANRHKLRLERLTGQTFDVIPEGRFFTVVAHGGRIVFPERKARKSLNEQDFNAMAGKRTPRKIKGKW